MNKLFLLPVVLLGLAACETPSSGSLLSQTLPGAGMGGYGSEGLGSGGSQKSGRPHDFDVKPLSEASKTIGLGTYLATSQVPIHVAPDPDSQIIGYAKPGTEFEAMGTTKYWVGMGMNSYLVGYIPKSGVKGVNVYNVGGAKGGYGEMGSKSGKSGGGSSKSGKSDKRAGQKSGDLDAKKGKKSGLKTGDLEAQGKGGKGAKVGSLDGTDPDDLIKVDRGTSGGGADEEIKVDRDSRTDYDAIYRDIEEREFKVDRSTAGAARISSDEIKLDR